MLSRLLPILAVIMAGLPIDAQEAEAEGRFWGFGDARQEWFGHVWEAELTDFSGDTYAAAVERLLSGFESRTGKRLVPDQSGTAGIKVYAESGAGLATPHALTRGVIEALLRRGFRRENLFLLGGKETQLREAGYLPPLSRMDVLGAYFEGVPVRALDSGKWTNDTWFYDSPLPQEFTTPLGRELLGQPLDFNPVKARKSFLPVPLVTEVDFWINLPILSDLPAIGINGALANATVWNVTNNNRFLTSPANAPVAVAEIAAIPELEDSLALTLLSLELYQYIGGPVFNSLYTRSAPLLWLSPDPVMIDALGIRKINSGREERGFTPLPEFPPLLEYANQLDLGYSLPEEAIWHRN